MDINKELMDFSYREVVIPLTELFPRLNEESLRNDFLTFKSENPHETIYAIARALWNGQYASFLSEHGFWDEKYKEFSGHCHQCTPILGAVLKVLGFEVSYLECFRIRESFLEDGSIVQVPPDEEPNPDVREEFCEIKRIPYCCLEVMIEGKPYYLTGKHLKPQSDGAVALLTPVCYQDFVVIFHHQDDESKSGIYLRPLSQGKRVVWVKQTFKDPVPELFATFLRMKLV